MKTNKATRYNQVVDRLVAEIKQGRFPVNSYLPSEPVLALEYGVSRSTLRTALSKLQSLGFVERRQGAGTKICSDHAPSTYVHSMKASGDLMEFAGPSRRCVHEIEDLIADEKLAAKLDNRPGRRWIRIGQTRHVEGIESPICWTDVYLPQEYNELRREIKNHTGLIYTLIEKRYDVIIRDIVQSIRAIDVPPYLSNRLNISPETKALELTRRYRNSSGLCEMVSISVLPAENYTYEITLIRETPTL